MFEVKLCEQMLDEKISRQMDKKIPYHILFILEYQGKYQAWIGYKEVAAFGSAAFKVNKHYRTEWMGEEELPVRLEGLDIDLVYENFVRQIAGTEFQKKYSSEILEYSFRREEKIQIIKKDRRFSAKDKKRETT